MHLPNPGSGLTSTQLLATISLRPTLVDQTGVARGSGVPNRRSGGLQPAFEGLRSTHKCLRPRKAGVQEFTIESFWVLTFHQSRANLFVPDGLNQAAALERTHTLGIGAHPDDLEFMGWEPILDCLEVPHRRLGAVTVSDGCASPRSQSYAHLNDPAMIEVRSKEQRQASVIGNYSFVAQLMYSEKGPLLLERDPDEFQWLVDDLRQLLRSTRPNRVFTHNLADSHPHHILVALATIRALRSLKDELLPEAFYGGEVWRSLDWLSAEARLEFDVSAHSNLTHSLMGVYDSQISGGKRYDLATAGRKRANATYCSPYKVDQAQYLEYAMDLRPLLLDPTLCPIQYTLSLVKKFQDEVEANLRLHSLP